MRILVTGGAGFIGSAVCRYLIGQTRHSVINLDALTYAANLSSLASAVMSSRYRFVKADIRDVDAVRHVFVTYCPDAVMHLAAESHVDRSINDPGVFIETNVVGTFVMLQEARRYWNTLGAGQRESFRFHHVSTDEVYGSLEGDGFFIEETPYAPSSPYSASKASADHLVRAWFRTFDLPCVISNCSNNYGPYHFPEKMIPLMILNALEERPLPVYGDGNHVRDWLYVEDHARALYQVLAQGKPGEKYNIGGHGELRNIDVVKTICSLLDELRPRVGGASYHELITSVPDRPGHDRRYAIDAGRIERELGWRPRETFASGMRATVAWYLANEDWWRAVQSGAYRDHQGTP